jgi:hypothetical protein
MDRAAGLRRPVEDRIRLARQLMLARLLPTFTRARQEGIGHPAADDQVIDLAHQVAEHASLVETLAPPTTAPPAARVAQRALERLQLRFHRPAGDSSAEMRDPSVERERGARSRKLSST